MKLLCERLGMKIFPREHLILAQMQVKQKD